MIKTITAYTDEIDDVEQGVSELLEQLDLSRSLCAHSVGILSCYPECIETGLTQALCNALPFDVIGSTTAGNVSPQGLGEMGLCLLVLTSDDLIFSAEVSEPLTADYEASLNAAYSQARNRLPGDPALILLFAPLMKQVTGENVAEILNGINPGIPLFGSVAVDYMDITKFSRSCTLFNGKPAQDRLSLVMIYGDLRPSFWTASLSEAQIQKQKGVVTQSEGNCVIEVNGMSFSKYLEKLGMVGLNWGTNLSFFFMIDYQDGTPPLPRSIYGMTPGGAMIFGGRIPLGATLAVGEMDYPEVLDTASEVLNKMIQKKGSGILLFSCLTRYIVLDADTTAEMELVRTTLGKERAYHFAYSGGEFCPVYQEDGRWINRFHNCSLVGCVL